MDEVNPQATVGQTTEVAAAQVAAPATAVASVQSDIENMKTAIAQFETAGAKLFPDQFAAMKQKLADMEAEAEAEAEEVEIKAKTVDDSFRTKHGVSIPIFMLIALGLLANGYIVVRLLLQ